MTRQDWDAAHGAAAASAENQDGLAASARLTFAPTKDGDLSYSPYVGLAYAIQEQSGVSEDAAAAGAGVGFAGYDRKSVLSEVGLKAEYAYQPGTTLTGVVAWEHEFKNGGETDLNAEFTEAGATDTRFNVTSTGLGADTFRLGVGVRVDLGATSVFSLGYDALISSDSKSGQGVKADVTFRF